MHYALSSIQFLGSAQLTPIALYIHKQTRSKKLIRIISKFGHSIIRRHPKIYIIDTFAHQIDQQTSQNGIFVPSNLVQGKFLHCDLDNLDFSENTKSGTTMHATTKCLSILRNKSRRFSSIYACAKKGYIKNTTKYRKFYRTRVTYRSKRKKDSSHISFGCVFNRTPAS